MPHCFRDFNSGSIGGGRGEKEGGTEVNKKDKTGFSGKQGGKRKEANKKGGRGQGQIPPRSGPSEAPSPEVSSTCENGATIWGPRFPYMESV